MGFLDRFKKKPDQFTLAATSRKAKERMFMVRDIEITVQTIEPHQGIANVYFRGGTENERDTLSAIFLTKLPPRNEMRYNYSVYGSINHEKQVTFRDPDRESLIRLPPSKSTQPPVITFEVLCHAAESLERQYKGRILGED